MTTCLHNLPSPLLDDIVQGQCIPIIGAGFSRNAELPPDFEMPLWDGIGRHLAQQMRNYPYTTPIDAISAFCHEFSRAKLIEQMRAILHVDKAQPGPAHLAFADLPFDIVVTTNFDFLLERAYDIKRKPYYPIVEEDQLSVGNVSQGTRILKIHGDLNHPSRLIVTEDDYDTFLEKYPLICTYLANLLISRTPLFIGYSLEDPDFRQMWQIIGARLGNLRRNAYTFAVGVRSVDISRYERRGVKVISLGEDVAAYGDILRKLFEELREYWLNKIPEISTITDEESLIDLSLPKDAQTRLCFFSLPFELIPFYRSNIFPIFERYGFTPITVGDVISPGENIIAKISSLIERASLVVVDISSSPWVMQELGIALSKSRKILIIKEEDTEIPSNLFGLQYLERPKSMELSVVESFVSKLEQLVQGLSKELIDQLSDEPIRLLKNKEYRAAVISAVALLEIELREKLPKDVGFLPLVKLLNLAVKFEYIPSDKLPLIREWISIRNRLVHTKDTISPNKANKIVKGIMDILETIRQRKGRET